MTAVLVAMAFAALYWVHDEPLLRHLGAVATTRRFGPTFYRHEAIREALDAVVRDPESARANRLSVLLGNHLFPQSMTVTHVLWAMFGILPVERSIKNRAGMARRSASGRVSARDGLQTSRSTHRIQVAFLCCSWTTRSGFFRTRRPCRRLPNWPFETMAASLPSTDRFSRPRRLSSPFLTDGTPYE
jgi:hypothetical protein